MLDHDLDFPVSLVDLCDIWGLCPDCGDEVIACRCEEDAELEREVQAHPSRCLCCASDEPVRVPFVRRAA
jgi:hypothetical protein